MYLKDLLKTSTERTYTDEGFLRVPSRIARVGTQEYMAIEMGLTDRDPKDVVIVYRPEEEVFSPDSMESFANKPITDNHPPVLVTAKNFREYGVGFSSPDISRDGDFLKTTLNITDAVAIEQIENGKVELSNGYTCDIDWTPGVTPDGIKYDAIQRNIKGNHIAIVERGRAGSTCRVADNLPEKGDTLAMPNITIDGVDYEVSAQAAQAIDKLKTRLTDAEEITSKKDEELKKKEDEAEEAAKEAKKAEDSMKAQLDDAKAKIPSEEDLDKMISDRMAFVDRVKTFDSSIEWQGKTEEQLMGEVVAAHCPNVQMDSVSNDYIKARFDILMEDKSVITGQNQIDDALSTVVTNDSNNEDNRPESVKAREKFMVDSRNAWKGENK